MLPDDVLAAAQAAYPDAGTLRVHPSPEKLHPTERDRPGLNRFDDPDGVVSVRYTATRLVGCLRETMARFRSNARAEEALGVIEGLAEGDVDWEEDDTPAIAEWLDVQRVGVVIVKGSGFFVDVESSLLLPQIDKHPKVRAAVLALDPAGRLDIALLRLGGIKLGRPISQAVGVAVREWVPDALGIGYRSRLAWNDPCWAIWETTKVDVTSTPLDASDAQHREAVQTVATEFEIELPPNWQ